MDVDRLGEHDYLTDTLAIERIEPGALWFAGGLGRRPLPRRPSELAKADWQVALVVAHTRGAWQLLETGFVYPSLSTS